VDILGQWTKTCRQVGARDDIAGAGARLVAAYGAPTRSYHDLRHLADVLHHLDLLAADPRTGLSDAALATVRLAAWYHDAVYDTPTPENPVADNEERSAQLAGTELARLRVAPATIAEVQRLVRLTRLHDAAPTDQAGAALCDADLAVLARDPGGYAEYTAAVRAEYAHVPDELFRPGRAAVLQSLLDLPALFRTPYGTEQWQARAVANLTAELVDLTGSTG
jgi:predicted metal-dependent HD superfamily phosphohydrolase